MAGHRPFLQRRFPGKTYFQRAAATPPALQTRAFAMPAAHAQDQDGLPAPQLYWGILVITLGTALGVLDGAIANLALPTIARTLHAAPATSIWVINAYQLAMTVALLPLSSLGDRIGYRKVYLLGLGLFTAASLDCALTHSFGGLVLGRIAQGFGAAGIVSVNTALVKTLYPSSLLGRGVSINASVVAIASAAGPTVAAAILSNASWPWLFAINVPLGIVAFGIGLVALPPNRGLNQRYDYASAILNALTLGLLVIAVDGFGHGSGQRYVVLALAGAIGFGFVFVRRQLNRETPMLPVDLLRHPAFALSVATSICSFVAQMLAFVSLPFLLQDTLGHSAIQTGTLITPWPLAVLCIAPFAGALSDRYPAAVLGGLGLVVLALGLALLALMPAHATAVDIAWRMVVCGLGFGLFQSPNNRAILAAAPRGRTGSASGMIGTARLLGQTLGAALVALIFNAAPTRAGLVALITGTAFAGVAACLSLSRIATTRVAADYPLS